MVQSDTKVLDRPREPKGDDFQFNFGQLLECVRADKLRWIEQQVVGTHQASNVSMARLIA